EEKASHDKSIALLLRQNALLESEINRLCEQLNEATEGILKRGYLHMWRDRTISYASRWGLRYFVLQGSILSYYQDEEDKRPRKTIDITDCIVRAEGEKKNGQYHVFGIYLRTGDENDSVPQSGLILRLSAENYADAKQWMDILDKASRREGGDVVPDSPLGLNMDSPDQRELEQLRNVSAPMIERVRSTELTLRKSMSLRQLSGSTPSSPVTQSAVRDGLLKKSGRATATLKAPPAEERPAESTYQRLRRLFPASRSMHTKSALSPLSSETRPNDQNYRGFFHLGVIILVMTHIRIIYDNFVKYGWLLQLKMGDSPHLLLTDNFEPVVLCLLSWMASIMVSLAVEKLAARRMLGSETVIFCINFVLSTCNATLPCLWVWYYSSNPVLSMIYLMQSVIIWMKLLSYAHTNRDLRLIRSQQKNDPADGGEDDNGKPVGNAFAEVSDIELPLIHYPRNITLNNLLYFCVIPTLCYQLNYPRSPRIRWKYVVTVIFRMVVVAALIIFFVEQYISPTLGKSMKPIEELNVMGILSLLLRLSVANTYVWLLGFYFFFHLWLNLFAELTRFGDRLFYKDWWNARTIDMYWQRWNLPVHHWMIRHCYYPILRAGMGKPIALFLVFFLSALFHEVIISVPFKQLTYHAFLGMIAQAPLTYLTKKLDRMFDNAMIGNCLFWMLFCIVGQPMGVLLHYYDLKKAGGG
ncbi:unnamed protein product, partial [Ectocarpus fasciculatus]